MIHPVPYIEQAVRTAYASGHDALTIKAMVDATVAKITNESAAQVYGGDRT